MTHNYRIDLARLTVIHTDPAGEEHDLNAAGEPCLTAGDLRGFIAECHAQGAFDAATRDALLADIEVAS